MVFVEGANLSATIKKLKSENYDLVINLEPSIKTKFLQYRLGVKNVLTYKKDCSVHAVVNFYQTVKQAFPDIWCPHELKLHVDKIILADMQKKFANCPKPFVAVNIDKQRYGIEKLLGVAAEIQRTFNGTVFVTGLDDENELFKVNSLQNFVNLVGVLSLKELVALCNICDLLISPDSDLLHVATAVGSKVIGLYDSTMILRTGPYGFFHRGVDCADTFNKEHILACANELLNK